MDRKRVIERTHLNWLWRRRIGHSKVHPVDHAVRSKVRGPTEEAHGTATEDRAQQGAPRQRCSVVRDLRSDGGQGYQTPDVFDRVARQPAMITIQNDDCRVRVWRKIAPEHRSTGLEDRNRKEQQKLQLDEG